MGQGRPHDKKNGQFKSFQQRNRKLEKEVENLERMVSFAAAEVDELQLQLNLSDRHPERRVKQIDSLEGEAASSGREGVEFWPGAHLASDDGADTREAPPARALATPGHEPGRWTTTS